MNESLLPHTDALPGEARALASLLAREAGGSVRSVLLYGSHLLNASPDRHSAFDLVVVVEAYAPFYRALRAAGQLQRPPGLFVALAGVLPPNVIAFTPDEGRGGMAKCVVVSRAHLEAALGPRPPDHFLLGRLVQRVGLAWAAGDEERLWLEARLGEARGRVLDWMAPYLQGAFDAEALGRRLMEVCYRGEIRPEAANRAKVIFEAQREHFREVLEPGLERAAEAGTLVRVEDGYRLARPVGSGRRLYWRWHFLRSKLRATARWAKYVLTFDNWLPYISRKVERRTGRPVELTRLERRLPLIFLWPRVIRVLLSRPDREDA